VKTVPLKIKDLLTPLAIAVWIMDDGGKAESGSLLIATHSFTQSDVDLLIKVLKDRYNINATRQKAGKNKQVADLCTSCHKVASTFASRRLDPEVADLRALSL
jgi:hypothetical protein